jgi:hypothetical protein
MLRTSFYLWTVASRSHTLSPDVDHLRPKALRKYRGGHYATYDREQQAAIFLAETDSAIGIVLHALHLALLRGSLEAKGGHTRMVNNTGSHQNRPSPRNHREMSPNHT